MNIADRVVMERRVVLEHAGGTLAGQVQIVGLEAQLGRELVAADIPSFVTLVTHGGRLLTCGLVRVEPTYVLFREMEE
jgi:hypothetical protein